MRLSVVPIILILQFFCVLATAGDVAPRVAIGDLSQLDVRDYPFNDKADANADVDRAFADARAHNKRVLIDLGANWCADCRILQALMDRPEVRDFLTAHYAIAVVNVGRLNRNLQVPARFGITERLEGVPAILIADPDGKLVNAADIYALEEGRHKNPQVVVDWLASWAN